MKVLIVDDHPMVRDALVRVLTSIVPGMAVREASEPGLAFEMVEREADSILYCSISRYRACMG